MSRKDIEKIVELINKVRADPVSYADIIEDSMQYIIKAYPIQSRKHLENIMSMLL